METNFRKNPDGSIEAPIRGDPPKCPKGYTRDQGNPYRFYLIKGFGDTVASLIDRFTNIKPCAGCQQRKDFLNKILPYESKAIYQELYTDKDLNYGSAEHDRCPGVRYFKHYSAHLLDPILDLGCGNGDTVRYLESQGFIAEGIDHINLNNGMMVGRIDVPLDDTPYLTAISIDVFEHLYDDQLLIVLDNMAKMVHQVITVNTLPSIEQGYPIDLHINKKTLTEWLIFIETKLTIRDTILLGSNRFMFLGGKEVTDA